MGSLDESILGKDVIIKVHNLHTGIIHRIEAKVTPQGEIYKSDTGKKIFPLSEDELESLGKIITYDKSKTDGVIETIVRALELLRLHPEYTPLIASIVDNKDTSTEEIRSMLIDTLKNPFKLIDTSMFEELLKCLTEIEAAKEATTPPSKEVQDTETTESSDTK